MVTPRTRPYEVRARSIIDNPPQKELRALTSEMPNARPTALGNIDVFTRVDSRSAGSTYIVTDNPDSFHGLQTMSRSDYDKISAIQDTYIARQEMIQIDGHISNAPEVQTAARLIIERRNANVAGMQKFLYFERSAGDPQARVHGRVTRRAMDWGL